MSLLNIDRSVTQRTVLSHGDVLLRGPMVTSDTGPQCPQIHQGPTRDNTRGELGAAARTRATRVRDHCLTTRALRPVGPRVLGTVLDKNIHG